MNPAALFALGLLATGLGLLNLYSASAGPDGGTATAFSSQVLWCFAGMAAFCCVAFLKPSSVRKLARPAWLVAISFVLVGVISRVLGVSAPVDPTMALLPAMPLALADVACRPSPVRRGEHWLAIATVVAVPLGFAAMLPGWGTLGVLALTSAVVIWTAGLPRSVLAVGALGAAIAAPVGWVFLAPAKQADALAFLRPASAESGAAITASMQTVASAGWAGHGFGAGTQGRLGFLPGHQTDFVLAHLTEEWGAIGAVMALSMLFGVVALGLAVAERSRDRFSALLAVGLTSVFGLQVLAHAASVLGLFPPAGIALPFFSAGAGAMLPAWIALGMLAAVSRRPSHGLAEGTVAYGPNETVPTFEAILAR